MRAFSITLTAVICLATGLPALADEPEIPSFESLDLNKNGTLEPNEAGLFNFKKTDTNKDGKIDKAEYDAAIAKYK